MYEDEITQYIQNVLQRDPNPGEVEAWQAIIDSGQSLEDVRDLIIDSAEAVNDVYPVILAYQAIYGRVPDAGGLDYWTGRYEAMQGLDNPETTTVNEALVSLLHAFVDSEQPEFAARYGIDPSGDQFVAAAYTNVLNRTPDQAGLNYWQGRYDAIHQQLEAQVAAGQLDMTPAQIDIETRAQILEQFVSSAEYENNTADLVDQFLANAAEEVPGAYSGSLWDLQDEVGGGFDQTLTLTTGADNIGGSDGNDLITGIVADDDEGPSGINTFAPGDVIDGGDGTDVLRITQIDNTSNFGDGFGAGATVDNVEILEIKQAYSTSASFDLAGFSGLEQIVADMTYDTSYEFYNLQEELVSVTMDATRAQDSSYHDIDVSLRDMSNSIYTGDDDTLTINVINAGSEASSSSAWFSHSNAAGDDVIENYEVVVSGDDNYLYINNNHNADGDDDVHTLTAMNAAGETGSLYLDLDEQEALESVDASAMTGDFHFEFSDTVDDQEVSVVTGAGDDNIVLGNGLFTVDLGAGDDRVELGSFGGDADDTDDALDGGDGHDTISMDADAVANLLVLDPQNFEVLGLNGAATAATTVDADDFGFTEVTLETDIAQALTIEDLVNGTLNIQATQNAAVDVESNGLADTLDVMINGGAAATLASLDVSAVEDVSFASDSEDDDLTITSLTVTDVDSLSFSGEGDVDIDAIVDADDVGTVDLSGLTGQFDNDGVALGATTEVTIGNIADNSIIELSATAGHNGLVFGAELDNDIQIHGFEAGPAITDDVLDLSALGITATGDLTFTDVGADVTITSDDFDGSITLVGVLTADLAPANFDFA